MILSLALLFAVGCSGAAPGTGEETGSTNPEPETTQGDGTTNEISGNLRIEEVSSGSDGLKRPQVVVAPSADAISASTGLQTQDAGNGTYLAAFWGEKPTGGYTVEILDARMEDGRVVVRLALRKPPPDAMVSQALTYPYAAAVIRDSVPDSSDLTFVTQGGRELDWPVRRG